MADFFENYAQWLDDCLEEYNSQYPARRYHQDNMPANYNPGELVEIAENGDVYPHGTGGTGHIARAVTAWNDSPHYID